MLKYGFEIELVRVHCLYSLLHTKKGDFDQAIFYLNKNVELGKQLEAKVELSDSYEQLGDLHKNIHGYSLSEQNYHSALNIRKELGHYPKVETISSKLESLNEMN